MQFNLDQINRNGELDRVLQTINFPVAKDEVIEQVQNMGATPMVVSALQQMLPEGKVFTSEEEIKKALRPQVGRR